MEKNLKTATESVKDVVKTISKKSGKPMYFVNCESGNSYSTFDAKVQEIIGGPGLYRIDYSVNGNFINFEGAEFIKSETQAFPKETTTTPKPLTEKVLDEAKYFLIMQGCIKAVVPTMIDELEKAYKNKGVNEDEIKYLVKDCMVNAPSMVNTLFMTLTDRRNR